MSQTETVFLTEDQGLALVREYGIPYPAHRLVSSAAQAEAAARELGSPVVMKIVSPQIVHKSDAGGVITGLEGPEATGRAFTELTQRLARRFPEAEIKGALICEQAAQAPEVIIGGLRDAVFGPVVMFGLGGIFAEALKDVAFRVAPIGLAEAKLMIREIKGFVLLTGLRGSAKADLDSLAELLVKVSELMAARPDIIELDLNPVRALEAGALALDVRIGLNGAAEKAA